jgi:uncharacterized protein (DUF58 family)
MIAPSSWLILLSAVLVVPACALASLAPQWALPCIFLVFVLTVVAAVDASLAGQQLARTTVSAATFLKWFKARPAQFTLAVSGRERISSPLEASLDLPLGLTTSTKIATLAQSETTAEFACLPQERGRYEVTLCYLRARSPLRLWHVRGAKEIKTAIRVFPDLEREPGGKLLLMKKTGGLRTQRVIGRGREFERLREYAPGDSYDEIAWKASARRGRPIVRVFQVERTQDVYAVIDSSRLGARSGAVEQYVSAALMLALASENNGDNFGLVSFSNRVDHFVSPARGKLHFARCRDAIFDLQPSSVSPDFAELFSFLQLRVRRRSLLLFLTDLADPMLAEAFLRDVHLLSRRHVVLVNRLNDQDVRPLFSGQLPENKDEISTRLAGHLQWVTLKDLERNLGRLGVSMSLLTPGSVGLDLVRQYNDVKRRQAL